MLNIRKAVSKGLDLQVPKNPRPINDARDEGIIAILSSVLPGIRSIRNTHCIDGVGCMRFFCVTKK